MHDFIKNLRVKFESVIENNLLNELDKIIQSTKSNIEEKEYKNIKSRIEELTSDLMNRLVKLIEPIK